MLTEHRRVDQATAPSLREFAERTRFRADTALALISDSEFMEGQAAIETAASHELTVRNYSDESIGKILGGNMIRVLRRVLR